MYQKAGVFICGFNQIYFGYGCLTFFPMQINFMDRIEKNFLLLFDQNKVFSILIIAFNSSMVFFGRIQIMFMKMATRTQNNFLYS